MAQLTRRNFMKFAAASGALLAAGEGLKGKALAGTIKTQTGRDFSPTTKKERQAIPTACWQCVTRDSMVGFVEDGRLVKLEGQPKSIRGEGYICARGQAGVNQVYDPDRILYPMKRAGARGEGKWKRISWDEALTELTNRLKKFRDEGHPEKFMFHYGRMKASSSKLIGGFMKAYGTKSIGNHTSVCESAKFTAQELSWGGHYDSWDIDNTKYILNFGSNILETHTNHIPVGHRIMRARIDRGVKMVTFDVRLSNTAAKSDEWVPVRPGTDLAVILAMCNVVLSKDLYKGEGEEFLKYCKCTEKHDDTVANKIAALKKHFAQYTPAWAEKISGVPASKIEQIATEFATAKPACLISYRGPIAHYNGVDAERAMQVLASITGNVDNPGGKCKAVGAGWKSPKIPEAENAKGLKIMDGFPEGHKEHYPFPTHHASQQVLPMIKDGKAGRPEVVLYYCYTASYANGDVGGNIEVLKDEKMIPFIVASDPFYGDTTHFADMILPDATYLERWDWEDMVDPTQVGEYYIRQPLVKPLGEARDFGDVCCELAERMGFPLGIKSKEEFVQQSCDMTPGVKEAGGFEYMKKNGVWSDGKAKYYSYKKEVPAEDVKKEGVKYDEEAGVYWDPHKAHVEEDKGYYKSKNAYKGYVATKMGDKLIAGFKPDKVNKSGYMELWSQPLKDKGYNPLPEWIPVPEHEKMGPDDLHLTTFKVAVQTHSRTPNCKWLTEIYPENFAWINSKAAAARGIKEGDMITVKSHVGEIKIPAHVTENVHERVVAISHHKGHWAYGRYASGKRAPEGRDDPDDQNIFWKSHGVHPNWIIPNWGDRIGGYQRWNDTVVKVIKV